MSFALWVAFLLAVCPLCVPLAVLVILKEKNKDKPSPPSNNNDNPPDDGKTPSPTNPPYTFVEGIFLFSF